MSSDKQSRWQLQNIQWFWAGRPSRFWCVSGSCLWCYLEASVDYSSSSHSIKSFKIILGGWRFDYANFLSKQKKTVLSLLRTLSFSFQPHDVWGIPVYSAYFLFYSSLDFLHLFNIVLTTRIFLTFQFLQHRVFHLCFSLSSISD